MLLNQSIKKESKILATRRWVKIESGNVLIARDRYGRTILLDETLNARGSCNRHGKTSSRGRNGLGSGCINAAGNEIASLLGLRAVLVFLASFLVVTIAKIVQCDEVKYSAFNNNCIQFMLIISVKRLS